MPKRVRYNHTSSYKSWAFSKADSELSNFLNSADKKHLSQGLIQVDPSSGKKTDLRDRLVDPNTPETSIVNADSNKALQQDLRACVGELKERERKVVLLLIEGLSQTDIASALEIDIWTVTRTKKRALREIRQNLKKRGHPMGGAPLLSS